MKPYRVEIFDSSFRFIEFLNLYKADICIDYLTLEKSTIKVLGNSIVNKGNYLFLMQGKNMVYSGLVTDYSYSDGITEINTKPFLTLFDIKCYANLASMKDQPIERWIESVMNRLFISSDDSLQNIPGLIVHVEGETMDFVYAEDNEIVSFYDVICEAFSQSKILIKMNPDLKTKKMNVTIGKIPDRPIVIETRLSDVLKYETSFSSDSSKPNKIIYYNSLDFTQTLSLYYGSDGKITSDPSLNRIIPVKLLTKTIRYDEEAEQKKEEAERKTFEEKCYEDAVTAMSIDGYNNLIEITVMMDSKVIHIGEIGQRYRIIDDIFTYETVLTGKIFDDESSKVKLIFGLNRMELTQILTLERRKSG